MNPAVLMMVGLASVIVMVLLWGLYLAAGYHLDYLHVERTGRYEQESLRESALQAGEVLWVVFGLITLFTVVGWVVVTVGGLFV